MKKGLALLDGLARYLLVPAGLCFQLYLLLPFSARLTGQWLALFAGLWIAIELLLWCQYRYFLGPIWRRLDLRKKAGWMAAAGVLSLGLYLSAAPQAVQILEKFPSLAPEETVVLTPIFHASDASLDLWKVKIGENRVADSQLVLTGAWQKEQNRLWTQDPAARLTFTGNIPRTISISFWRSPSGGQVQAAWNGKSKIIDLHGQRREELIFEMRFDLADRPAPALTGWLRLLTLPGWVFLAFLASGVFSFRPGNPSPNDSA